MKYRHWKTILFTIIMTFLFTISTFANDSGTEYESRLAERYLEIAQNMTEQEIEDIKQLVWYEAARSDCSIEVLEATVQTVFNRVLNDQFPNTVTEVIWQKGQFAVGKYKNLSPEISERINDAIAEVVNGELVLPDENFLFFATLKTTHSGPQEQLWVGKVDENGAPVLHQHAGMFFRRKY